MTRDEFFKKMDEDAAKQKGYARDAQQRDEARKEASVKAIS